MYINPVKPISCNIYNSKKPSFKSSRDTFEKGITVNGTETHAKIFTKNVDYKTIEQIKEFCNHPVFKDTPIRIMPDTHAGVNSVVGFSAPVKNEKVIPNIIGGDIGCGVLCVKFDPNDNQIDFKKLDDVIKNYVSASRKSNQLFKISDKFYKTVSDVCKYKYKQPSEKVFSSIGTLGGGNHFIEIDKDDNGEYYLVIHTGSRNFGREVGKYHQEIANKQNPYAKTELSYLSGPEAKDYLEDMQLASEFSKVNRMLIADEIIKRMGWNKKESFESIHNYISADGIIRKGAISADSGQQVIIPLNMRDGSLIATGKGNSDWNNTAPHGSGRKYKRSGVEKHITFDEYKKSMEGIYSSCITPAHLDESPQAYKDSFEIIENIEDTVQVNDIISPVFNYKD